MLEMLRVHNILLLTLRLQLPELRKAKQRRLASTLAGVYTVLFVTIRKNATSLLVVQLLVLQPRE